MTWINDIHFALLMLITAAAACLISVVCGHFLLPVLKRLKIGQTERDDGPQSHLSKTGTPTMGGIMILAGILVACLIFSVLKREFLYVAILTTLCYGAVGFWDDYIKVVKRRSLGLKAMQKIILQLLFAFAIALYCYLSPRIGSELYVPFIKRYVDFKLFYIPLVMFDIIATTNSVNLTDGLDGLASSVSIVVMIMMAIVTQILTAKCLNPDTAMNMRNMIVFSSCVAGACAGFLYYNHYPAKVFMGDTGSMALGGAFVIVAILTKTVLIIPFLGLMFMVSSVSDIIQVASYKLRNKKRVFLMAPLHHHFEKKGYSEISITIGYVIVTVIMAVVTWLII